MESWLARGKLERVVLKTSVTENMRQPYEVLAPRTMGKIMFALCSKATRILEAIDTL